MKFMKQPQRLHVEDHDFYTKSEVVGKHGFLFPSSIRAVIYGLSGSGKTNVMISLLKATNGLKFENVYVYSKSSEQPKYKYLEELLKPIKGIKYSTYSDKDNVITLEEISKNSIMIFDDVACLNQDIIRDYFCRGRHSGVDSFYFCQTYSKIPKQQIRDNENVIVLFKQDNLNLKHVYDEHIGSDMTFEQFKSMGFKCWQHRHDFMCKGL